MFSINYIVSILKDAGFTKAQLKPATPSHVNKLFADYLNSCEWSEEWFFSIDPSQLDGEQLKLYDSAKELYDTPDGEVLSPVEDNTILIKFSEFYALCVYYHTMKHLHSIDVWANGDAHKVYASYYTKALLSHYCYDDEYLVDIAFEKDFSDVVGKLVHDPYDLWVIAHMTSKLVNDYRDELHECLWYVPYKAELIENFNKYVPIPTPNSQYIIACNVEVVEPVRDDVKLPEPVEVIVVPQEVVSEPQEDIVSSTTTNEDLNMNTSTFIPSWEVSGYVSLLDLDFGTYVPVVESEPIIELNGQYSELTCNVLNGWIGKASELTCHISDGWFGQCCDLADAPKPVEPTSTQPKEEYVNHTNWRGKRKFIPQWRPELRPTEEIKTSARIEQLMREAEAKAELQSPTITTKSGKKVQVSPHCIAPHGNAPATNCITNPKVTSAIGEAEAVVTEFKSTLINLDEYDITRNIQVDMTSTTPKATPKATVAPKVSTATFASNFNSLVMAEYRKLNGGIIKDSLVLNKLTSALRANNVEAYTNLVTTFGNPTAVALHRQAYDAVVSAS